MTGMGTSLRGKIAKAILIKFLNKRMKRRGFHPHGVALKAAAGISSSDEIIYTAVIMATINNISVSLHRPCSHNPDHK